MPIVLVKTVVEGLARLGFAAGALDWHKPFLATVYAWTAVAPSNSRRPLPLMMKLAFDRLFNRIREVARVVRCRPMDAAAAEVFRTNASATEGRAALGGCRACWEASRRALVPISQRARRRAPCAGQVSHH